MYLHDKYKKKLGSLPISNDNEGDAVYDGYKKIPYVVVENNINDPNYYIIQYDSVISYIDAQIGRLLDSLKALDLDKNTLIILTSDHGEMLGEHNIYFSHMLTYEENIKVPLIIRFPKLFPKGKVISRQVSLVDIAPTILEIVGLKKPSYMQGESLLAFTKPLRVYNKKYVLSCFKHLIALRAGDWKIIHNSRNDSYELYNLKDDPKEQHNLLVERTDKFKQLKQELCRWQERITASTPLKEGPPLTEKDKAHLKSLGYAQ